MFNTYHCALGHDTDAFEKAIKESEREILHDPIRNNLLQDLEHDFKLL